MVDIRYLPASVDRRGLEALMVLARTDLKVSFDLAWLPCAADNFTAEGQALMAETIETVREIEDLLKYASSDDVLEHLMTKPYTEIAEQIAFFLRDALACGYYLLNGRMYRAGQGLKSTAKSLVVPLFDGSAEIIPVENVKTVQYDAESATLFILYDDNGSEGILQLVTMRSPAANKEALLNHGALGPVLARMQESVAWIMPIGSQPALTEPRVKMPNVQDWLLALDPVKTDLKLAAAVLSKTGYVKTGYLGYAKNKLKQFKNDSPSFRTVAQIWKKKDVQIFVFEDLALAKAFGAGSDFVNRRSLPTKKLRHQASARLVSMEIDVEGFDDLLDMPSFIISNVVEEKSIKDRDHCRLNHDTPLTEQSSESITGIPALMRFAYDLLEDGLECDDPETVLNSRAVMAFAHIAHDHQTLRYDDWVRAPADQLIAYDEDKLHIADKNFSRLSRGLRIRLSANQLKFEMQCDNFQCTTCAPTFRLTV